MEWNGCHFGNSKLIIQIGKSHSNKHDHNEFRFNEDVPLTCGLGTVKCFNMDVILVVVNQFSKLEKIIPTNTIITTFNSTKLFFDMWIKHHRMPQFIVIDRDTKFMVGFWKHSF